MHGLIVWVNNLRHHLQSEIHPVCSQLQPPPPQAHIKQTRQRLSPLTLNPHNLSSPTFLFSIPATSGGESGIKLGSGRLEYNIDDY